MTIETKRRVAKGLQLGLVVGVLVGLSGLIQTAWLADPLPALAQTVTVDSTQSPLVVNAAADLADLTPTDGQSVIIKTGAEKGLWYYDKDSVAVTSTLILNGPGSVGRFLVINKGDPVFNVLQYGADPTGLTDSASAIQDAADAATANGGVIYFPTPGIYLIGSQVAIESDYPVSIISEMGADYEIGAGKSLIGPFQTFAGSLFKMNCPGGTIQGLYFKDPTSSLGSDNGDRGITACIEADYFSTGNIVRCCFDGIKGSCIKSRRWVRGRILDVHIRDSGDTSKPAIWLNGESDVAPTQAIAITNPHIEVCYGDSYIKLGQYSPGCRISNGQFEADELIADSNHTFIEVAASTVFINECGFTVNSDTFVVLNGSKANVTSCSFNGAPGTGEYHLHLANSFCNVTGCQFWGTAAHVETSIYDQGGSNNFTGCNVYAGGNIILGDSSTWSGGSVRTLASEEAYAIVTASNAVVSGTLVTGSQVAGGIRLVSNASAVGNTVVSNAGYGIRCESSGSPVIGNRVSGNTAGNFSFTAYPHAYISNANHSGDGVYPLQTSTTWDPGSLANGASTSTNVTVTGAVNGDSAVANFPVLASASSVGGIQISCSVYSSNNVKVSVTNNSGGVVDLDSGTLTVKVIKN